MTAIAVVEGGDGIGREVIPVARDVLALLHPEYEFYPVEVGYATWQRTGGEACGGADAISLLRDADAILFGGAVTTPPASDYRSVVLQIRKELDLYANLRPIQGNRVDIMVVRENTEGLYSGIEWQEEDRASTLRVITRKGSERIARTACRIARERKNQLTIGNKANVIKSDVFFRDICIRTAEEMGVSYTTAFIDALTLDVLMHPERYDVIVTTNIFGDILSDAAAYLVGGDWVCCPAPTSAIRTPSLNRYTGAPRISQDGGASPTPLPPSGRRRCCCTIREISPGQPLSKMPSA